MFLLRTRLPFALILVILATACGGDKDSPTAPTAPSQGIGGLSITEATVSSWGAPGDVTYTLSMRLTETSGRVPITLTTLSLGFDNSGTATAPLDSVRLGAGASERLSSIKFSDKSGRPSGARLTLTIGFRDENSRTGSATASIDIQNLPLVTLSGRVTDRTTGVPIANATVRVQSIGPNENKTARTDASGFYALSPLVAGAFRVFYEAAGYTGQSHPIDISTDAPWNVALEKVPPDVEYTITGTARRCDVTYQSSGGGTSQSTVTIPWSYSRTARTGDFLYVSCQISTGGDTGSIFVRVYKRGNLLESASATGFPNIATASGTF